MHRRIRLFCVQYIPHGPLKGLVRYFMHIPRATVVFDMNSRKKVLIIDDEVDLCVLLTNHLGRKNYEVYCSNSLTEGMVQFQRIVPDILFLDNNLPDGLGWEKVSYLLKAYPSLQLHLITAYHPEPPDLGSISYKVWEKPLVLREIDKFLS